MSDLMQVASGDGIKLQGFVEIELISTKDNVRRTYKNTVTKGGKQYILDKSVGRMLEMAADAFGMPVCSNVLAKVGTKSQYPVSGGQNSQYRAITNVLLNLGSEATGLSETSTYINVFESTLDTASKVIGYANNNVVPTSDGKEGAIDYTKGEYVIDPYAVCKRWKYDAGVATGTIDTIAMMPASCIKTNNGDGVQFSKCLDKINQQSVNYGSMSTGFLPPGIPGYTANDEVLLNYEQDGKRRHKFNLTTGVVTDLADTDPYFVIGNGINSMSGVCDIKLIGQYLYVLDQLSITGNCVEPRVTVYDTAASMAQKAQFSCDYLKQYEYMSSFKFLYYNNVLYVTTYSHKVVEGRAKLWTLFKGANAWFSNAGVAQNYNAICTLPSGMTADYVAFGNYGSNYIMYVASRLLGITDFKYTGYKAIGYVFTSMADIGGTIVDIVDGINPNSIPYAAGTNLGWLRIGFDLYNTDFESYFGDTYDYTDKTKIVTNNSTEVTMSTQDRGVFWTADKWWTNVISFVKLQTAITKQDTDIMYVSYGYKVV